MFNGKLLPDGVVSYSSLHAWLQRPRLPELPALAEVE